MPPGKKAAATKNKQKKKIHILLDTMNHLHLKFLTEHDTKLWYAFFCKFKRFYMRKPKPNCRKTCDGKRHENVTFKGAIELYSVPQFKRFVQNHSLRHKQQRLHVQII